jgi:hypothetical protein
MNEAKLSALCAKARGWHTDARNLAAWFDSTGEAVASKKDYNPLDDANQADDLLEYVATEYWAIESYTDHYGKHVYHCIAKPSNGDGVTGDAETQNLAKILCSLRASPEVMDAEINDAMEGE